MADLNAVARVAGVSTGTSVKTLVQIVSPTNQRLKITEVAIGFHGITNTDAPITVELVQQSTAGTSSSLTPVSEDSGMPETVQSTALQAFSAEPTLTNVIRTWAVHPQQGAVLILPIGREIKVSGGKRIGLRVTAGVAVNADAYIRFEE